MAARPSLVDRLTRNWYARDVRFHGALRADAEAALARFANETAEMPVLGGEYQELAWRLVSETTQSPKLTKERADSAFIGLNAEEWTERSESEPALGGSSVEAHRLRRE